MNRHWLVARTALALAAGLMLMPGPAQAQFSKSFKFLEAVRKKEGSVVTDTLNEPGSTIVNTRDSTTGETALHIVTARRDVTWMTFLLAKGANPDLRDSRGATPLQTAVNLGFQEGVELLVGQRARVDDPNSAGETPLITAVHRRNVPIMRMLLKAGADPDRADNSGRTARDYASLEGQGSSLLAEIQANAKAKNQRAGSQRSYGPSL